MKETEKPWELREREREEAKAQEGRGEKKKDTVGRQWVFNCFFFVYLTVSERVTDPFYKPAHIPIHPYQNIYTFFFFFIFRIIDQ